MAKTTSTPSSSDSDQARRRIAELRELIERHNDLYYRQAEPNWPASKTASPTW